MTGRLLAAGVAIGLLLVSCSDNNYSSTPATSEPAASVSTSSDSVCADRDALRASIDALRAVDVVAEGTNGLTAALDDVKAELEALRTSASAELKPQVQAVQDDFDTLQAAVSSHAASDAVTALSDLATSTRALMDALDSIDC